MNIVEILQQQATSRPEATAIIDTHRGRQRHTTFAELENASVQAATVLLATSLSPGDPVLVFQPMSAELYIVLAATFRLGLVAMFLDPGQGREHIEQCCRLHPPKALIASPKAHLLRFISPALRRIPHKFVVNVSGGLTLWAMTRLAKPIFQAKIQSLKSSRLPSNEVKGLNSRINPAATEAPALITFTSGSTGQPKAALRTHGFLLAQHRVLADSLSLTVGQVDLATMPIVTLANLASGVTSLIPKADLRYPGKIDPAPVVEQMQAARVESTVASPALLERLVRYCRSSGTVLPDLQKIFSGGAPVFPRLLDQLRNIAPNAEAVAVYGSTEAEPMAKIAYRQLSDEDSQAMKNGQGLLAGSPVDAIRLEVIQNQWGKPIGPYSETELTSLRCSPGEIGEIVVSGDHVLTGYLHGRGDEETKFQVDGTIWHRTGDAGYLDRQGRLWLLGRCAARIEDARGELYPFTVETAVSYFPEVRRSAMIAYQGRRMLAVEFCEQSRQDTVPRIKEAVAWAQIDIIKILNHIPVDKRHNAKIDYPALYKLLGDDS